MVRWSAAEYVPLSDSETANGKMFDTVALVIDVASGRQLGVKSLAMM
ncbi:hypothetical protein [Nocardia sp. NPDC051981]